MREEGCRAMAKRKGHLERISCIDKNIGVAGSRFLRGVAGKVYCDWEYEDE